MPTWSLPREAVDGKPPAQENEEEKGEESGESCAAGTEPAAAPRRQRTREGKEEFVPFLQGWRGKDGVPEMYSGAKNNPQW